VISKQNNRGFTLIESILASVLLCASVLVLVAISSRSVGATTLNRHYEKALGIAEKQLAMIDYVGIDYFIEAGRMEGDIENSEPNYHWQVEAESIGIDNLYKVVVTVSWVERSKNHNVSISTRLNGTGNLIMTTEI